MPPPAQSSRRFSAPTPTGGPPIIVPCTPVTPSLPTEVTQVGMSFLAAALPYGADQVVFLANPKKRDELGGLAGQIGLAESVLSGLGYGEGRLHLIDDADPDAVEATLYGLAAPGAPQHPCSMTPSTFLPVGGKRSRAFLALRHLHDKAPAIGKSTRLNSSH